LKDYGLLLTMLLNDGRHGDATLLCKETVDSMFENHIGALEITPVEAQMAPLSNNLDMGFGSPAKWGLGFLLHTQGTENGRSPESASWAGLFNSYFWIDREKDLFGVFATQVLPFMDRESVAALTAFERAIYGLGD
jgi:CubicO group peptidase (beta-lactamase class C family)